MSVVAILGTGSMATEIAINLISSEEIEQISIVSGSSSQSAISLTLLLSALKASRSYPLSLSWDVVDYEDKNALSKFLLSRKPNVLVQCSSLQSPSEFTSSQSGWTRAIKSLGFALTIPMQTYRLYKILESMNDNDYDSIIINCCFPDAVNPWIKDCFPQTILGVGNISTIYSFVSAFTTPYVQKLIAHHSHLNAGTTPSPIGWDETGQKIVPRGLNELRLVTRPELNRVAGRNAAALILDLLTGITSHHHMAGALGLPGGYPVTVENGNIKIDLPKGLSINDAINMNNEYGHHDGINNIKDNIIMFTDSASDFLKNNLGLGAHLDISLLDEYIPRFIDVRKRLRLLPA